MADDWREVCREVAWSGVEFDDARLKYVVVQIDRDVWERCQAALAPPVEGDDDG